MKTNLNKSVEKRFNSETLLWDINHEKINRSMISSEVHKRKIITGKFLLKRFKEKEISILEIGCGTGENLHYLLNLNEKWSGTGVDISPNMISKCKKKYSKIEKINFQILNIDAEFLSKKYDVIVLLGVIGYLKSNKIAFSNIDKMLKPRGTLVFTYGNKYSFFRFIRNFYSKLLNIWLFRKMVNIVRFIFLNRKDQINYKKKSFFSTYSKKDILKCIKTKYKIQREYNLGFASGLLGPVSIKVSNLLERMFLELNFLNLALTKMLILRKKK